MQGLEVIYLLVAVGMYAGYTRKQGGRPILGALLWPALIFSIVRRKLRDMNAAVTRKRLQRSHRGVRDAPPPEPVDLINLPKYGQIDPTDE